MDFSAFDTKKMDEYAKRAREQWGNTAEYREFEEKSQGRTKEEELETAKEFMQVFAEFGELKQGPPASEKAQKQVRKLQDYITKHFYTCSDSVQPGADVCRRRRVHGEH